MLSIALNTIHLILVIAPPFSGPLAILIWGRCRYPFIDPDYILDIKRARGTVFTTMYTNTSTSILQIRRADTVLKYNVLHHNTEILICLKYIVTVYLTHITYIKENNSK